MENGSFAKKDAAVSEKFSILKSQYIEFLQSTMQDIDSNWESIKNSGGSSAALDQMIADVHKIAGSGGTFGFHTVSEHAKTLEGLSEELRTKGNDASFQIIIEMNDLVDQLRIAVLEDVQADVQADPAIADDDGSADTPPAPVENVDVRAKHKILIVDDDQFVRQAIRLMLTGYDVDISEASNGREGYDTVLMNAPDLIISDYNMPDGGGHYFLGRLVTKAETARIPVILITATRIRGRTAFALKREMLSYKNVTDYIEKPLEPVSLINAVIAQVSLTARADD